MRILGEDPLKKYSKFSGDRNKNKDTHSSIALIRAIEIEIIRINSVNLVAANSARPNWAKLSQTDWKDEEELNKLYTHLKAFSTEIKTTGPKKRN